jgi:hypothetical protein
MNARGTFARGTSRALTSLPSSGSASTFLRFGRSRRTAAWRSASRPGLRVGHHGERSPDSDRVVPTDPLGDVASRPARRHPTRDLLPIRHAQRFGAPPTRLRVVDGLYRRDVATHLRRPGTNGYSYSGSIGGIGSFDVRAIVKRAQATINASIAYSDSTSVTQSASYVVSSDRALGWLAHGSAEYNISWQKYLRRESCSLVEVASGRGHLPTRFFGFNKYEGLGPAGTFSCGGETKREEGPAWLEQLREKGREEVDGFSAGRSGSLLSPSVSE